MPLKIFDNAAATPIQLIDYFDDNIALYIKREDLIHPLVSGNKWRKLKYNLLEARRSGYDRIITFGGAFSNHIHATAAAASLGGFKSTGVIRGEIVQPLNPTLQQAVDWGMELVPIDRERYRKKTDHRFLERLKSQVGDGYIIPEGGTNLLAIKGCREMTLIDETFDYWCLSCGTGGTMAGLLSGLGRESTVLGFPALKGGMFLKKEINSLLEAAEITPQVKWQLIPDYHFGGYARITRELLNFIVDFRNDYGILLDPVYTGKMMYGLTDLIKMGFFPANSRILALHTGGLQGITGIEKKYGIKLK